MAEILWCEGGRLENLIKSIKQIYMPLFVEFDDGHWLDYKKISKIQILGNHMGVSIGGRNHIVSSKYQDKFKELMDYNGG